jgi:hypothetical protein
MRQIDERQAKDFAASIELARRSADAADLSAKAALGAELPALHIVEVSAMGNLVEPQKWIAHFYPIIRIKNYGRTPAFVSGVVTNMCVARTVSAQPAYSEFTQFPTRFVIPGGETYEHTDPVMMVRTKLTEAEQDAFLTEMGDLFVFGVIRFKDFLGMSWEKGFLFNYVRRIADFNDAGRVYPAYDYQRLEQPKQTHHAPPTSHPPS